jgi:phosphohistidine phosphatase
MNLFFLRHGKAEARSPKWRPDSKRPLTREGENAMFDVARGIKALDVSFDVMLTSPYIRALRTAEILAEVYDSKKLFETPHLAADADVTNIVDEINENFSAAGEIVLVGHEPSMTGLISTLLTGEAGMAIELKKAGFCKLTIDKLGFGKCALLNWLLTPKQLVCLSKGSSQ